MKQQMLEAEVTKLKRELSDKKHELASWKINCLNLMNQYSDLCTAAGYPGYAFFEPNAVTHEEVETRVERLFKRSNLKK